MSAATGETGNIQDWERAGILTIISNKMPYHLLSFAICDFYFIGVDLDLYNLKEKFRLPK